MSGEREKAPNKNEMVMKKSLKAIEMTSANIYDKKKSPDEPNSYYIDV
jgi:hypothetical protein